MARQSFPEHQLALLLWRRSMTVAEIGRRSKSVATMRKKSNLALPPSLAAIVFAAVQASPSSPPANSPTPEQTPLPSPSAPAVRTVQLGFVPPPKSTMAILDRRRSRSPLGWLESRGYFSFSL